MSGACVNTYVYYFAAPPYPRRKDACGSKKLLSMSRALTHLAVRILNDTQGHSARSLLPPLLSSCCVLHHGVRFLLHRPYIRLDDFPLFDTLFTGVPQGGGARGASGVAGMGMEIVDLAAANKARMWMLRALRDGKSGEGQRALKTALSPMGKASRVVVTALRVVARALMRGESESLADHIHTLVAWTEEH